MTESNRDPWFEYETGRGRISAMPVSASGWMVLAATVLVPIAIALAIMPTAMSIHPMLLLPILLLAPLISIAVLSVAVKRKGRRVSR